MLNIDERTTKATVRIETGLYEKVTKKLHYGQLSQLFVALFNSLDEKISSGKFTEILDYLYKGKKITFKAQEGSNDPDEQNKTS